MPLYTLGAGGIFELNSVGRACVAHCAASVCAVTQSPRGTAARGGPVVALGAAAADFRRPNEKVRRVGRFGADSSGGGSAGLGGAGEKKR